MDVEPAGAGGRQQRRASGFPTKAAAVEAMSRLQVEKSDGTHVDPTQITLGDYLDLWLADAAAHGWEPNTRREYGTSVELHLKPYLGATRLQALSSLQIRGHYQWLRELGKIRRNKEGKLTFQGPLSAKTVQNVHICLRAALNDAVAADPPLLRRNVAIGCYTYSRRKQQREMLTWSAEEVRAVMAFTRDDADYALWCTALMTGMRRGELLGLRRRDLDLERARLNVRQQYARDGRTGLRFKTLKQGSTAWRTIDLDDDTVDVLRSHLEAQEFSRRSWADAYHPDLDLVFCHPDGSPYDPDSITTRFERRARNCPGVLDIRLHDCRHTHATLMLENGETERYVAERLGDTVEMIHQTYGHVTQTMREGAVKRLAQLIGGKTVERGNGSGGEGESMPSAVRKGASNPK